MKPLPMLSLLSLCISICTTSVQAQISDQLLDSAAAALKDQVIAWRRDIHANPELGNREFRTSALVAAHLTELGYEVKTGIAHTGVVGILRGGREGPVLALRADMDALPVTEENELPFKSVVTTEYAGQQTGVMHACGHDTHVAMMMGVASVLAGMQAELSGTVMIIFQPAEEGPPAGERGGAELMLEEGLFAEFKPDAVFGMHSFAGTHTGVLGFRSGPFYAQAHNFTLTVTGKQTHGARPWLGVDPIVVTAQIVTGLQTIISRQADIASLPAVLTVGTIHGGIRHNIIPDEVVLQGTLRTFDDKVRDDIVSRIERTATGIAAASGATADLVMTTGAEAVLNNDPALTARVLPSLQRAVGAGKVVETPLVTAAEDFALLASAVPGFFFTVGVTPPEQDVATAASNHSPLFFVDEDALAVGVKAMLYAAVDFLQGSSMTGVTR